METPTPSLLEVATGQVYPGFRLRFRRKVSSIEILDVRKRDRMWLWGASALLFTAAVGTVVLVSIVLAVGAMRETGSIARVCGVIAAVGMTAAFAGAWLRSRLPRRRIVINQEAMAVVSHPSEVQPSDDSMAVSSVQIARVLWPEWGRGGAPIHRWITMLEIGGRYYVIQAGRFRSASERAVAGLPPRVRERVQVSDDVLTVIPTWMPPCRR